MNDRFLAPAIHLMRELNRLGNGDPVPEKEAPLKTQPGAAAVVIGREIRAAGGLRADGGVVLDGSFSGDIHCRTAKITGRLTGNLRCRRAVLRGAAVIGDVSAFVFDADGASRVFGKLIAGKIVRPGAR